MKPQSQKPVLSKPEPPKSVRESDISDVPLKLKEHPKSNG